MSADPLATLRKIAREGPIEIDDPQLLTDLPQKQVGFDVRRSDDRIFQGMNEYVFLSSLPKGKASGVVVESDFSPPEPEEIDMTLEGTYLKWIGRLAWLARLRFDLAFAASELAAFSKTPTERHLAVIITLIRMYAARPKKIVFVSVSDAELRIFIDSGFRGKTCSARSALIIQLADRSWNWRCWLNILDWATYREKRLVLSAPGGELLAIRAGLKRLPLLVRSLRILFRSLSVRMFTDSATSLGQTESGVSKKEQGLTGILKWCAQELGGMNVKLQHVSGEREQLADGLTK
mmetsp:Transcript_31144/g.61405  ORF Transcript_31144/g.61405 Transcript_31144/m.61405 type:complete len:292 (-) Transcript_31144:685-1560(-)